MAVPSARLLHQAVLTALRAIDPANLEVFDGEVDKDPRKDNDKRTHPYLVLYSDPGSAKRTSLCGTTNSLEWGCEVVCVGGDQNRCLWAVDKARAVLDTDLTIPGQTGQRLREEHATKLRPVGRDDTTRPARFEVSLLLAADSDA